MLSTDDNSNAQIFKRNPTTGQYASNQTITASNSTGGCISGDGQFLGFQEVVNTYQIHRFNSNTNQYDSFQNFTGLPGFAYGCQFLENNNFLIVNLFLPKVFKFDGMSYASHQSLKNNNLTTFPILAYRNPYLMQPANDPSNNLVIYFHEYNQTSDQWESNFQESIPNQFFDVAISANLKFIAMSSITGSSVIEEGSVANGYSSFKSLNTASVVS